MKQLLIAALASLIFSACNNIGELEPVCEVPATVRDLAGLDGCGWAFELNDGTKLVPYFIGFCGTPPLPKEVTEDPLYNFEYVDGKKVMISYETVEDSFNACMAGPTVKIKCITESSAGPTSGETP